MNKLELINTLRFEAELTKSEAAAVVDLFFNEMANALAKGDRVEIRGLCSFYVKKYKAYAGRNTYNRIVFFVILVRNSI